MTEIFPGIEYNLSCDKIIYNNDIESLKNHSLNIRIGKIFKDVLKSESSKRLFNCKNSEDEELPKLENLVNEQLAKEIGHLVTESLRKTKVHFMTAYVSSFLKKYPYLNIDSPENLFPHVVFTSQGTINTMKSLKYFRCSNFKKMFKRFQLSCHLFLKEVKHHFRLLPYYVKANVVTEMKNDFFIEFCVREAQINHELIREAFEGYPYDKTSNYKDSFINAIKTDNEIAVDYLWRNKISKMNDKRVILDIGLKLVAGDSLKTNIMMFLLFQVNKNEFVNFFEHFSFVVIENVIKEVRWHCLFDKIFDALKIYFNSDFILKIFGILTDSHCTLCPLELNLDLVANFFSSLSASDKICIMWNCTPNDEETLSSSAQDDEIPYERVLLMSLDRVDYLEKMLRVDDSTAIKDFFISERGVSILSKAFRNEKVHNIDQVLRNVVEEKYLNYIYWHFNNISR